MRLPREAYPIHDAITAHLPCLRPAQVVGLTWWVFGAILAGSVCQSAVLLALAPLGHAHAQRQRLRAWGYAGADKALPSPYQVEVAACFPWLLRSVRGWWQGRDLALALDATSLGDRLVVLTVSVLYRGTALPGAWHVLPANRPGAWHVLPANRPGAWNPALLGLLAALAPAVPPGWRVLVLTDRGLWSPAVWDRIRTLGWHPLMRVRQETTVRPVGRQRVRATRLVPGPGHAWIGAAPIYRHKAKQRRGTVLVVWDADQAEPWVLVTSVPATRVGVWWYGLRTWIELGFGTLKRGGWHWERTRWPDPARVARHWLVQAVAMLWTVATGTRVEDAARLGRDPAHLTVPAPLPADLPGRTSSCFQQGLTRLRRPLGRGRPVWATLWLRPDPWPTPPPGLLIHRYDPRAGPLHF